MAHGRIGNNPTDKCKKDVPNPHNLILHNLPRTLVNAAFARVLWYNIGIFYTGEFCVTDKNSLEKLKAEYEQKIALLQKKTNDQSGHFGNQKHELELEITFTSAHNTLKFIRKNYYLPHVFYHITLLHS